MAKRCKFHKKYVRTSFTVGANGIEKAWVECAYCNKPVRDFKCIIVRPNIVETYYVPKLAENK